MNFIRKVLLAAAIASASPVHAQSCSGGPDGGMDATGNQCNRPAAVAEWVGAAEPKVGDGLSVPLRPARSTARFKRAQFHVGGGPGSIEPLRSSH
jgi:hypothetical protein